LNLNPSLEISIIFGNLVFQKANILMRRISLTLMFSIADKDYEGYL